MGLSRKACTAALVLVPLLYSAESAAEPGLTLEQGQALARQQACLGCHLMTGKRVGPGFLQVAQRYAGQPEALDYLTNVIRQGGRDKWGAVPMPGNTRLSEPQARQLAQWVLSLKN